MSDLLSKALQLVRDDVKNHWEGKGRWANPLVGKKDEKILDRVIGDPRSMPLMMALGLLGPKARAMAPRPEGQPKTVNLPGEGKVAADPIPEIVAAQRDYMRRAGIDADVPQSFPPMDKARAARIAAAYDEAGHTPNDPKTAAAYQALIDETLGQYDALTRQGIKFEFMKPDGKGGFVDPYAASPALGYKSLRDKGKLEIFPTEGGFGTANNAYGIDASPMLRPSGRYFGDKPATANDVFRAVHDAYGHFGHGNAFFRAPGEERAWMAHSAMFSPQARQALTSETRGQNSWVNYGPHGEINRSASGADTIYAPQKVTTMPEWTATEGMPALPRASRVPELPARGVSPLTGFGASPRGFDDVLGEYGD